MQSAFISYSTKDEAAVLPYEQRLKECGTSIWRDKSGLRQGQLWPMKLGEAIAEQEAMLLFWSVNAAASHFVTLEWNTALALQKSIIPVLLDDTPLPDVLKPYHGFGNIAQLKKYLRSFTPTQEQPSETVLTELKAAREDAGQALDIVKQHVQQNTRQDNWQVDGNVYQPKGDVYIIGSDQEKMGGVNRWSLWLGAVALLSMLGLALSFPERFHEAFSDFMPGQTIELTTTGLVQDQWGNPLAGVTIQAPEWTVQTQTNAMGWFEFTVSVGSKKTKITSLNAQKIGYTPERRTINLGNSGYNFILRKE